LRPLPTADVDRAKDGAIKIHRSCPRQLCVIRRAALPKPEQAIAISQPATAKKRHLRVCIFLPRVFGISRLVAGTRPQLTCPLYCPSEYPAVGSGVGLSCGDQVHQCRIGLLVPQATVRRAAILKNRGAGTGALSLPEPARYRKIAEERKTLMKSEILAMIAMSIVSRGNLPLMRQEGLQIFVCH